MNDNEGPGVWFWILLTLGILGVLALLSLLLPADAEEGDE